MSFQPRESQVYAMQFMAYRKRAILADGMGVGKTCSSIGAARLLKSKRVLIVCPNSLMLNWMREFDLWWPTHPKIALTGTGSEKLLALKAFDQEYKVGAVIVNLEACRAVKNPDYVKGGKNKQTEYYLPPDSLARFLSVMGFDTIIVDEAHRIANRKSLSARGIKLIARAIPHRLALTGTPIRNRVTELWSILNFINPSTYSSFWRWAGEFAGAKRNPITNIYEVLDVCPCPEKLERDLAPIMLRRTKAEVLDLPELLYTDLWVNLEGRQARLYRQMEKRMVADLGGGQLVVAPIVLAKLTRLKQIAVDPMLLDWHLPENHVLLEENTDAGFDPSHSDSKEERAESSYPEKFAALLDLLSGTQEKAVVFSQYTKALRSLEYWLEQEGISCVVYAGDVADTRERERLADHWKNPQGAQVMLANTQVGGEGHNWTEASTVIFLDQPWNPATVDQCVSRVHRSGQNQKVQVVNLLARDTIDEWIGAILDFKGNLIEAVMGRIESKFNEH